MVKKFPEVTKVTQIITELFPKWKSFSLIDQMKTKNFYICLLFITATSTSIWLLSNPSPNLHTIVTQTHKQINNIKNIPTNIRSSNMEDLKVDPKIMESLGFLDYTTTLVNSKESSKPPIVATAALPGQFNEIMQFIKATHQKLNKRMILIHDLGISSSESLKMSIYCNKTRGCTIKPFQFDKYPQHIRYLDIQGYRPIAIQETLKDYGAVMWAEPPEYFITGKVNGVIAQAQQSGVVAWTIMDSASSLIHPKMFRYFKTKQENYYFLRSAKVSHLILYNTDKVHKELMMPWVKCALTSECISPTGAQNVGCNYDQRPRFKYSGCHKYDMAAFNVILGIMFDFDVHSYEAKEEIFGVIVNDHQGNSSSPHYVTRTRINQIS